MSEKSWIGGIYLKEEGGYEILLKSLTHYEKRLKNNSSQSRIKRSCCNVCSSITITSKKKSPND
jgi:hypothetical protein